MTETSADDRRAARYDAIARRFDDCVAGVTDWDAPTPVPEWRARDVVDHLATWLPAFIASGSTLRWEIGPGAASDPVATWRSLDAHVRGALRDQADVPFSHERIGDRPLGEVIDGFFVTDVLLHTWDLARASGQDDTLDPVEVETLYAGMTGMADVIRSSGQFGVQQPVAADAPVQDQLIAFIGRDPQWRHA
ncbi:MAG: maleylpyruvate isomerase N-terminal domain-containing protein [Nocardioides sp.]